MQIHKLLDGKISRQQWWTGVMTVVAVWLVWSLASDFLGLGDVVTALLSIVFLVPLTVLSARRMNDLEQRIWPMLALAIIPFILHTGLTGLTDLGGHEASFETGISESTAIILAPNIVGWVVLAWLAAAIGWMALVLGSKPGASDAELSAAPVNPAE